MQITKNKKGQLSLNSLGSVVTVFVVVGLLLGIGLYVLQNFYDKLTSTTQSAISTNETIWALGTFSSWFSIIITVVAAAVILGIVFRAFGRGAA